MSEINTDPRQLNVPDLLSAVSLRLPCPDGQKVSGSRTNLLCDWSVLKGKIGIFGGSFDPVHLDHLDIARSVKIQLGLDAVVFLPTPRNPLKPAPMFTAEDRTQMLLEVTRDFDGFFVSRFEIERQEPGMERGASTIETLEALVRVKDPDSELFLIVGSDCLPQLNCWERYHEIFGLARIVPVQRGEDKTSIMEHLRLDGTFNPDELKVLEVNWVPHASLSPDGNPISSTSIRNLLLGGLSASELVPGPVEAFCKSVFGLRRSA